MMPNSFLEQARETDSLDASSDDPLPMGLFKFLKNISFSFSLQIMKEKGQVVILRLGYFNRFIHRVIPVAFEFFYVRHPRAGGGPAIQPKNPVLAQVGIKPDWYKKTLRKLEEIQKFSDHCIFQKYIKGVAVLSGIF